MASHVIAHALPPSVCKQDSTCSWRVCRSCASVWCRFSAMQAATPLAAVFTFFVRDMSGMLGSILFAFWQVRLLGGPPCGWGSRWLLPVLVVWCGVGRQCMRGDVEQCINPAYDNGKKRTLIQSDFPHSQSPLTPNQFPTCRAQALTRVPSSGASLRTSPMTLVSAHMCISKILNVPRLCPHPVGAEDGRSHTFTITTTQRSPCVDCILNSLLQPSAALTCTVHAAANTGAHCIHSHKPTCV